MTAPAVVLPATVLALLASLSIMTFGSMLGRFAGELIGRRQGASRERATRLSDDGAFYGFAVGFACWLVLIAIYVL